jgi:hypothetical protein
MWIVIVALILGIVAVLCYAAQKMGLGRVQLGARRAAMTEADEMEDHADDPEAFLAAARELAASGQYRRAYRAVFLALLLRMDHLEWIRFDRTRTNGEYLRALRSRPDVLTWLRPLATDFDLHWYGGKPVEEVDFQRILNAYQQTVSGPARPANPSIA